MLRGKVNVRDHVTVGVLSAKLTHGGAKMNYGMMVNSN